MADKTLVALGNVPAGYAAAISGNPEQEIISHSMGAFASGEPYVELFYDQRDKFAQNRHKLRGAKAQVVYSPEMDSAEQREQLYLMADNLKRAGVKELTVLLPAAPFERQDKDEPGKFYSHGVAVFARNLRANGADRVIRLTPHSQGAVKAWQEEFGNNFIQLSATELLAQHIRSQHPDLENICIGAPDGADKKTDEGQARAFQLARALFGDLPEEELKKHMFFIAKKHEGFDENGASITVVNTRLSHGEVKGKHCIIVDDMIDGGSTMLRASGWLRSQGAGSVEAAATHGILPGGSATMKKLLSVAADGKIAPLDRVTLTDSLPSVEKKLAALREKDPDFAEKVTILSTASLIQKAITELPPLAIQKTR